MKKNSLFLFCLFFALLFVTGKNVDAAGSNPHSLIELNRHSATIYKKCSVKLVASVQGKKKSVRWKSSNSSIASVSSKGKVTGKKAGKATITARANGVKATCKITVKNPTIKLNKTKATIDISGKKTIRLSAKVKGKSSKIVWKSSKPSVAVVDAKGKVTAKKTGKTTISAKANRKTAKCTIIVVKKNTKEALYTDILNKYCKAISEHWDVERLFDERLCYLLYYTDYNPSDLGYAFIDVDKNGTPELFIGKIKQTGSDRGVFFDMYTIIGGKAVKIDESAERAMYFLCQNNKVHNHSSDSALISYDDYYSFDGNSLSLIEALKYDAYYDENDPWFYSTVGMDREDSYSHISEKRALEIINSYTHMKIPYTPFSEYLTSGKS